MHKIIIIVFITLFSLNTTAQYQGYTTVKDTAAFRVKFMSTAKSINSIKSDFTQEKNMNILSEKITSKGKFWFKKEDRVRMEYISPYQYLLVINKNDVTMKDGQKTNKFSAKSNKLFQQISRLTVDCIQGTAFANPDFKIRIFENSSSFLIEMNPVTGGLKEYFSSINIEVSKRDYSVLSIDMREQGGDNTLMRFSNKELNSDIPDAVFVVH